MGKNDSQVADAAIDYEWVTDAGTLDAIADSMSAVDVYAIDTEFHRERTYWPRLALVQLAWRPDSSAGGEQPTRVALVDALECDVAPLRRVFESDAVAVLHAAAQDLEIFVRDVGTVPAQLFDTQISAGFLGMGTPSLANLLGSLLDVRLPKADRLTDWMRRPLDRAARAYAAADVYYLIDLYEELVRRLRSAGRDEWAREECDVFRRHPRPPQTPETAWWKLKGSRQLRGRARGVAQSVAAWREREAARRDKPTRLILSDLAVMGIAHKPPADRESLLRIRGMDGRQLRGGAAREIIAAARAGRELSDDAILRPQVRPEEPPPKPLVTFCAAFVAQVAEDCDVDASLLATRDDITAFLRGDDDAGLRHGWRHRLAGADLDRLLAGELALVAGSDRKLRTRVAGG